MKKNIHEIEEIKVNNDDFKFNCYRILYKDDKFNMSFGNFDKDNDRVLINTDINFSKEEFKRFFESMLHCIFDYQNKTGDKFLEIGEDEENE